ncbi:hypothetical protein [Andreprevotia chitinilytica]|nr:hypothetical protein [Andreprevotia chitinilytica]
MTAFGSRDGPEWVDSGRERLDVPPSASAEQRPFLKASLKD